MQICKNSLVGVVSAAALCLLGVPTPAMAAPVSAGAFEMQAGAAAPLCEGKEGQKWYKVYNVVKPKRLTHYERYYNGSGEKVTTTFNALKERTFTAGITITGGTTAEAGKIIAKLEVKTEISLAAAGTSTTSTSVGIEASLPNEKSLVAYAGNVKVSGEWTRYYCNNSGYLYVLAEGKGSSFGVRETGVQRCDLSAPSGSLAAKAKAAAC